MPTHPLQRAFWRTRTRMLLGGLLALLAVTTVLVRTSGESTVRVVEQGFSRVVKVEDPRRGTEGISWAAIVENPRDQVAHGITLRLTYRGEEGTTTDSYLQIIDTLLPGQRVGIGGNDFEHDIPELDGPVTGVDVAVDEVARWESPENHDAITVRDVWAGYSPDNLPTVTFTAEPGDGGSGGGRDATEGPWAWGTAVLRDRDGEIVGAATGAVGSPTRPEEANQAVLTVDSNISDVSDVATADVYVHTSDYEPS